MQKCRRTLPRHRKTPLSCKLVPCVWGDETALCVCVIHCQQKSLCITRLQPFESEREHGCRESMQNRCFLLSACVVPFFLSLLSALMGRRGGRFVNNSTDARSYKICIHNCICATKKKVKYTGAKKQRDTTVQSVRESTRYSFGILLLFFYFTSARLLHAFQRRLGERERERKKESEPLAAHHVSIHCLSFVFPLYCTVTLLARLRGQSTLLPRSSAM